jgi:hypothetical protein
VPGDPAFQVPQELVRPVAGKGGQRFIQDPVGILNLIQELGFRDGAQPLFDHLENQAQTTAQDLQPSTVIATPVPDHGLPKPGIFTQGLLPDKSSVLLQRCFHGQSLC